MDALDSFDPAATTTTASTEGGALSSEGKGPIEDESSLEDGTIVNMRVSNAYVRQFKSKEAESNTDEGENTGVVSTVLYYR